MASMSCANCTNPNCNGLKPSYGVWYCQWGKALTTKLSTESVPIYSTSTSSTSVNTPTIKES